MNSPELYTGTLRSIYDFVTGKHSDMELVLQGGEAGIKSARELGQRLHELAEKKQLPAIVQVHVAQPPFDMASGGWHVINVYDYNETTGKVRFSNQWSESDDHMTDGGIPISNCSTPCRHQQWCSRKMTHREEMCLLCRRRAFICPMLLDGSDFA